MISNWLVVLATLVLWIGTAHADRKRVVVLEFDGPKAEKFHDDVVKLIKKSHTVVSAEKWNGAAEELDASKVNTKNVKKVAKKLKVDGVVTGKVEKRRDEYILRLKLRAGTSGEVLGNSVQTKSEEAKLDSQAKRDIKDELVAAIDELESNRSGGGDDEEEDKPAKKKGDDEEAEEPEKKKGGFVRKGDDEEEKPAKKSKGDDDEEKSAKKSKGDDDEDKPAKKKKMDDEEAEALSTKKDDEEEEEPREKKRPKSSDDDEGTREASADDDESIEEDVEVEAGDKTLNVSPGRRAVDAVVGLSFTARRLGFTYAADLGKAPPGYKQAIPVAGALVDLTVFPMAFSHKNKSMISNIGLSVLYDKVLVINSQKRYADGAGMQQVADLKTEESRWGIGAVFRYPLGKNAKAPVVGGGLTYGRQKFNVQQVLPNNEATDIPNVHYTLLAVGGLFRMPLSTKMTFNADIAFLGVLDTGAIQTSAQYGAASVTAFEGELSLDYMLTKNIFARAGVRAQTFGITFKGDMTSQTHTRDNDATDQDVAGARDTYFGGTATVGYLY